MLKLLFLLLVVMLIFAGPIAALRRPWAVKLWRRLKLILFAYVIVIFLVAITRLIFNWDQIYG